MVNESPKQNYLSAHLVRIFKHWTKRSTYWELVHRLLPYHASAWRATSESFQHMLSADSTTEQNRLTQLWVDEMQRHLQTICVTSALVAGVVSTSLSWPTSAVLSASAEATVQAIWYSALVLAITSIASASQISIFLSRVNSCADASTKFRNLLGKFVDQEWKPRGLQLFIFQIPVSLQNASLYGFVLSLVILVYESRESFLENDKIKVIVIFSLTWVYAVILYLVTTIGLYQ